MITGTFLFCAFKNYTLYSWNTSYLKKSILLTLQDTLRLFPVARPVTPVPRATHYQCCSQGFLVTTVTLQKNKHCWEYAIDTTSQFQCDLKALLKLSSLPAIQWIWDESWEFALRMSFQSAAATDGGPCENYLMWGETLSQRNRPDQSYFGSVWERMAGKE